MMGMRYRHQNIATIVDAFGSDTIIGNRRSFEFGVFTGIDGETSTVASA
jgi:hypothetical protein